MKLLFFFTTFRQIEENKYQKNIFQQLNNLEFKNLSIDIILHNNNNDYNIDIVKNSFDINNFCKIKYINNIDVIHTNKNIGYLWGAQEAISDNFYKFVNYDFVVHLNTDVYILNLYSFINYLYDNIDNNYSFFVNYFRNNPEGFNTDLCIFKPKINIYNNYNNLIIKKKLKRAIPEHMLKYSINKNNLQYKILPKIFIPINDNKDLDQSFFNKNSIYHIHNMKNIKFILSIL